MRSLFCCCVLAGALGVVVSPSLADGQEAPVSKGGRYIEHSESPTTLSGPLQLPVEQPAPPADVKMRQAVEALGKDRHQFVRCRLRDGSIVTGAVTGAGEKGLTISQGALGSKLVAYSQLKEAPQPVAAPGEHALVGLEWVGLVAAGVAVAPLMLLMGVTCGFQCS